MAGRSRKNIDQPPAGTTETETPAESGGGARLSNSASMIASYIRRAENLIEERKAINGDIKDIMTEAKSNGFSVKALRKVIQRRAMDALERQTLDSDVETYEHAAGGE